MACFRLKNALSIALVLLVGFLLPSSALSAETWCVVSLARLSRHDFALGIGDIVTLGNLEKMKTSTAYFLGEGHVPDVKGNYLLFLTQKSGKLLAISADNVEVVSSSERSGLQILLNVERQQSEDCNAHAACNAIRYLQTMGSNPKIERLLKSGPLALLKNISATAVNLSVAEKESAEQTGYYQYLALQNLFTKKYGLAVQATLPKLLGSLRGLAAEKTAGRQGGLCLL